MSRKNPHGHKFERDIDEIMKPLFLKYPCFWGRVIDSAAAGNLIESVHGDFDLFVPTAERGKAFGYVVECKASTEHVTLATCFKSVVRATQVGKMRLKMRAGLYGVYLFYSVENDEVEVWSGKVIADAYHTKRQKFYCQPAVISSLGNFPKVAESWVRSPQEFLDKLIRSETVPVGVQQ